MAQADPGIKHPVKRGSGAGTSVLFGCPLCISVSWHGCLSLFAAGVSRRARSAARAAAEEHQLASGAAGLAARYRRRSLRMRSGNAIMLRWLTTV